MAGDALVVLGGTDETEVTVTDDASLPPRVVVRSRVPGETGPSGGPALTDALGVVEYADAHRIDVRRADGTLASIAREDIVTMKPVPPRRARL